MIKYQWGSYVQSQSNTLLNKTHTIIINVLIRLVSIVVNWCIIGRFFSVFVISYHQKTTEFKSALKLLHYVPTTIITMLQQISWHSIEHCLREPFPSLSKMFILNSAYSCVPLLGKLLTLVALCAHLCGCRHDRHSRILAWQSLFQHKLFEFS